VQKNLEASLAEALAREQVRRETVLDRMLGGGEHRLCRAYAAADLVAARDGNCGGSGWVWALRETEVAYGKGTGLKSAP